MPEVLNVFKIVIDFIWNVWNMPISIGAGYIIRIWYLVCWVTMFSILIKFVLQDFSIGGGDRTGKFSKGTKVRVIKKNSMKVDKRMM